MPGFAWQEAGVKPSKDANFRRGTNEDKRREKNTHTKKTRTSRVADRERRWAEGGRKDQKDRFDDADFGEARAASTRERIDVRGLREKWKAFPAAGKRLH